MSSRTRHVPEQQGNLLQRVEESLEHCCCSTMGAPVLMQLMGRNKLSIFISISILWPT
jgi:hypothetical protein